MRRIGLCIGNFDPIYTEVIRLCEDIIHEFGLDYVLFAPHVTSSKPDDQLNAYIEHRKDMIRLATWGNNKIGLSEFDIPSPKLTHVAELSDKLGAKHNAEIFNIITSRDFCELPSQPNFHSFVSGRNFIVAVLPHFSHGISVVASELTKAKARVYFSTTSLSSTTSALIRAYIQLGAPCTEHVSPEVLEYINRNFLYRSHSAMFERIRDIMPEPIYKHTVAACLNAIEIAQIMNVSHSSAIVTALLHNIGKCFASDTLKQQNIYVPDTVDRSDMLTRHGRLGEIAAKYFMGVTNPEILTAIRYHSTGHKNMSRLTCLMLISATLAHEHSSEDYRHYKYSFFNDPQKVFYDLLSSKYKRARAEYPFDKFPTPLREAYRYYKDPKNSLYLFPTVLVRTPKP